jgi:rod shape-determining protein MreC
MSLFPKDKRAPRLFLALLLFHFLLISLQVPRGASSSAFERGVFFVFSPIQHGVVTVVRFVGSVWNGYFNLVHVRRQNRVLARNETLLRQQNALLKQALETAMASREMKARLETRIGSILTATVISLDPVNYSRSLVVDRGHLDGLAVNMVVLDRYGHLVGRVVEPIGLKEASVQLITDDASGTSVFIEGDKGLGIVSGDGRGRCRLKYILDTAPGIVPGDEVLTSGFDKIYPWGIRVGRIVSLKSSRSLFKDVVVQPDFRFRDLGQVAILKERRSEE